MPPTFAALHAPSPEAVPSTLPLTSSAAAALRSRGIRRASDRHPPPLGAFLPAHSGCPLPARGCFASHSHQPRGRTLHPAVAAPPPCRPAPSRNAHDPIAPSVWPPPFLALGGAPMPPRLLAASASARFSPRARAAATRPCRWGHVHYQPFAGQSRRQRVHNRHAPPLGAFLPPIRGVSFTSRRSMKRRDGKIDYCWLPSNDVTTNCKLDFAKPRLTTFVGFCSQNLTKPTF